MVDGLGSFSGDYVLTWQKPQQAPRAKDVVTTEARPGDDFKHRDTGSATILDRTYGKITVRAAAGEPLGNTAVGRERRLPSTFEISGWNDGVGNSVEFFTSEDDPSASDVEHVEADPSVLFGLRLRLGDSANDEYKRSFVSTALGYALEASSGANVAHYLRSKDSLNLSI